MRDPIYVWNRVSLALKIDPDPRMHHVYVHIYNQLRLFEIQRLHTRQIVQTVEKQAANYVYSIHTRFDAFQEF